MLKLKLNHTPRDVKVLTDQLVDKVNTPVETGPTITPFMETVLASNNASEAQTNLGMSAFAQSLLDDASGSDALNTLGVSDFAKSLLDDSDATAALTTLGFSDFVKTLLDESDASTFREAIGAAASGGGTARAPKVTIYKNPDAAYHAIDPETKWARVVACGAGGGGGGKSSTNSGGGILYSQGGGAGQTVFVVLNRTTLDAWIASNPIGMVNPKPPNTIYVKPGTGGIGGSPTSTRGGQGGITYFHSAINPSGGQGGQRVDGPTPPASPGGTGAPTGAGVENRIVGSYTIAGGDGGEGGAQVSNSYGGASYFGPGPRATVTVATTGRNASAPGAGGAGVGNTGTTTATGGAGANGIVIVEEYFG